MIYSRATAVVDAETALAEIVDGYESGSASLRAVLDGLIQLRDQRIAFLAITRDYNQAIASYALNVTAAGLSHDRVVSMLIDRRSATKSVLAPLGDVQPPNVTNSEVAPPRLTERPGNGTLPVTERPGNGTLPDPREFVPVKRQPGAFVPPAGPAPGAAPEDNGFRLKN